MKWAIVQRLTTATPEIWARIAACFTLVALVFMVLPLFVDSPLLLVVGMSLSHVLGLLGVLCFAVAVLKEVLTAHQPANGQLSQSEPNKTGQSSEGK
jgi:hypothetical protein